MCMMCARNVLLCVDVRGDELGSVGSLSPKECVDQSSLRRTRITTRWESPRNAGFTLASAIRCTSDGAVP